MKRATLTIPDDLERAVYSYVRAQDAPPSLTAVVQAALRQFLAAHGYLPSGRSLHINPAPRRRKLQ